MRVSIAALLLTGSIGVDAWVSGSSRSLRRARTVRQAGKAGKIVIKRDDGPKQVDRTGGRALYLNEDSENDKICYDAFFGPDTNTNVMVLPYLYSPKNQGVASQVEAYCRRNDLTYLCADYHGVSQSGGRTEGATITRWTKDTIQLLDEVVTGKTILVGCAVGAWVMMRVAMERPDLVSGLVGISSDPDFTEELLWANLSEEDKAAIMAKGKHEIQWGSNTYEITKNLILDGRDNLVLQGGPKSIEIPQPIRLMHGSSDEEVPVNTAMRIMDVVTSTDVIVRVMKGMTHFIEGHAEYQMLLSCIDDAIVAAELNVYDLKTPASG